MHARSQKTVPVPVNNLRRWNAVLYRLKEAVYYSGHLPTEDKKKMLSMCKIVRTEIDETLQLDLFSPAQLKR